MIFIQQAQLALRLGEVMKSNSVALLFLFALPAFAAGSFDAGTVTAITGETSTSATNLRPLEELVGASAAQEIKSREAELRTDEGRKENARSIARQRAVATQTEIINAGGEIDFTLPQLQDPDDPFVVRATPSSGQTPWNQPIQLSSFGGEAGNATYHKASGSCQVSVAGLVTLGSPLSVGTLTESCVVYAKNTVTAGYFFESDRLTLQFTRLCNDEGLPLTATAPSEATVGGAVQINATGGGCVGQVDANLNDQGIIQYFETSPVCSVSDSGLVTGTQAGSCQVTVTKSFDASINPSARQTVTVTFNDPDVDGTLTLSAAQSTAAIGDTVALTVTGGGAGQPLFSRSGSGCSVNSNGELTGQGNVTCVATASKNGQASNPVCVQFGVGSATPPVDCIDPGYFDGPLEIIAVAQSVPVGQGYHLGTRGGGTGTLKFENADGTAACTVSSQGWVVGNDSVVCKARARREAADGTIVRSNNYGCVAFGSAVLPPGCSDPFAALVIAAPQGLGASVNGTINLTFTGGQPGPISYAPVPGTAGCNVVSSTGAVTRATAGVCPVRAYKGGDYSNTLCLNFGGITLDGTGTCTQAVAEAPAAPTEPTFTFSALAANDNDSVPFTLTGVASGTSVSFANGSGDCRVTPLLTTAGDDGVSATLYINNNQFGEFVCRAELACTVIAIVEGRWSTSEQSVTFTRVVTPLPSYCP